MRATYAQIDLSAIAHNVSLVKKNAGQAEMMAVVKADAYGHGAIPVARTALENGAKWLAVATAEEAEELRDAGFICPVLVLGALDEEDCALCVARGISVSVSNAEQLRWMHQAAKRENTTAKAHLKIDTGFHRLGAVPEQLPSLLEAFSHYPNVKMEGMFTHFAAADAADDAFVDTQVLRFQQAEQMVQQAGFTPIVHISNSAATLRRPELRRDMVRAGIILYGYMPSEEMPEKVDLWPAMSWKSMVLDIHTIEPGETVGYGRTYTAHEQRRVATLPVGYADGYRRALSNKGQVLVCGQRAPVLGRICMDHFMVDITEIPQAEIGAEVVLLGRQGDQAIWADEMAGWLDTISYEILTDLSKRVPRVYV